MSGDLRLTGEIEAAARKMLRRVCGLLDEHQIPYVLEGGTLLGIIREDRLLPWDNDVDITITEEYLDKLWKLRWWFFFMGYKLRQRRSKEEMPHFPVRSVRLVKVIKKKRFLFKGPGLMDIFVKKKIDEKYYWIVGATGHVLKSVPCHFYEKRGRHRFDGYDYSVPADYEEYLTYRYGEWRQVVKEYNFKKDDKSIVKA